MKTRHIFVILFGLALLLVAGSKQTFAANGLFGTIIYSQTTPGTYTWPVPAGVTNIHITAAGGGSAIGRQQVTHTDLQVHAGDVFNVSVGGAQQSPAYGEIIVGNQFTGYKKCTDGTPGADTVMTKQNGYITELTSSGLNDDRYSSYSPSFYHITLNLSDVGNPCDTSQGYYIPDHGRSGYLFIEDTSNTVNAVTDTLYQPRDYKVCVEFGSGCDKTISAIGPLAVQIWGAGGGGGNSIYGSGTTDAGGGGGGGYTTKTFNNLVAGTAYYIHVGQGGDGAQYNVANAPGGNGDCSNISVSSSASCSNAGTRATGGGGSYEAGNPRYGVAGTGIGGDTNLSGTDGSDASINNYGGVSGKPACSSPMYINQSMCINDRHQDNRNANSIDLYNIVGYGSDNFKAALITTALKNGNSLADTSGGDGYSPGNGGANGAGATAGGNGGDGMVVISYTVLSTTPNVPTGLTATAGTCGTNSIDLSWSTVTGASSYKVYQNGVPVSTINQPSSGTIASTTMSSLAAGGGYEYEVSSIVSGVESATSTPPVYQFAPSACFDYSLSNLGTTVQLGLGASAQVPVTVHKLSGTDSDVGLTLSIPSTPLHTGTSGSLSPSTVHLTSSNAISQATMSALSTALQGTFTVTVSGSATDENGAAVLRSTTFPVQVFLQSILTIS